MIFSGMKLHETDWSASYKSAWTGEIQLGNRDN